MSKIVLGIETSCDDTSVCLLKETDSFPEILALKSFEQIDILKKWGGVVPEIAARNHLKKITPLLDEVFKEANLTPKDIDLIGVTTHPGLLGPLLTGLNAAKSLALLYQKPIVSVNHLFAHLEAIHLTQNVSYPYMGLLISGGHSIYFWVESETKFTVMGSTIDDAAGEAFDKGGKLMGLGYPAGKKIDDLAKSGDKSKFEFPIGLKSSADARLSFSGLKTSMRLMLEKNPELLENPNADLCASYQDAIVKALLLKARYAIKSIKEKFNVKDFPIVIGGGVACNSAIRSEFMQKHNNVHIVDPKFCTDNGAMIANYTLRTMDQAIPYPQCLELDSRGRYINKKDFV
jgi:N6-L-threonylcarbamoyladenine synthase